ncbi:MAG: cyclase family protein [Acidimicrobiia bacterium]|nr:cyclase family protein [Acidimicrobiia bacterium]
MPLSDELREVAASVSNWGRWGDDDERGTQNLIDTSAVRRGVDAVRLADPVSLAIPLDRDGPQEPGGAPGRIDPRHEMLSVNQTYTGDDRDAAFNDDEVRLSLASGTHLDALAHVTYEGRMYNGFPADLVTEAGAARCGAEKIDPIVTRGVLLDVAATKGVDRLEPGYALTAGDLDAALEHARVDIEPGDAVLVRTGHVQLLHGGDVEGFNHDCAGMSVGTIRWLHRHDVSVAVTDTYVYEVWPPEDWDHLMPVHMIQLRDMGLIQGQNWDFEELTERCVDDGVYAFQLVAAPEPFTGALSAPVHPVAIR